MTGTHTFVLLRGICLLGTSFAAASCSTMGPGSADALTSEASVTIAAPATVAPHAMETARYQVSFVPSWNPATNPIEYPYSHAKQGFLTPTIGATHGADYAIFAAGTKPTAGLEKLSETGKPTPLDAEIMAAIDAGTAQHIIRFADGSPGPVHPTIGASFDISADAPRVSLVGMIAPSPDWFYGVSGVELCRKGSWVANLTVPVYAWDSGGDAGTTYLAEDMDLEPKQPTRRATTPHFTRNGEPDPIGYFVFKQIPQSN